MVTEQICLECGKNDWEKHDEGDFSMLRCKNCWFVKESAKEVSQGSYLGSVSESRFTGWKNQGVSAEQMLNIVKEEASKLDSQVAGAETLDTMPSHYHDAPCDVIQLQSYVMGNCTSLTRTFGQLWAIGAIVKHICRLGKKDDVGVELRKIENYAHYARTGKWIGEEKG